MDGSDLSNRARWIATSGWLILLLSAGSALLPLVGRVQGALVIGGLLLATGLIETFAGSLRHETRRLTMAAGGVTAFAGLLFALQQEGHFLPTLAIVAGWLFVRALILFQASRLEHGSVRWWTGLSSLTDFLLALLVVVGLQIATVVVSLFGATPPLVASFAWVLAASFVANGLLLLEVASCARQAEDV